jgi:D-beta-D-heptose 7-phosphate kinase/D-beta-D-heptose 1-phosphate adenosyltransferase
LGLRNNNIHIDRYERIKKKGWDSPELLFTYPPFIIILYGIIMKVWVNGTFDVLHIGHVRLLEYASSLGSLRVGIDSDKRVKELKGEDRPFNTLQDRIEMLLSLKYVNDVKSFDSREEMINLIKSWEPDYMIVGSDYKNKPVIGSEFTKNLLFFDRLEKHSTSKILSYDSDNNR